MLNCYSYISREDSYNRYKGNMTLNKMFLSRFPFGIDLQYFRDTRFNLKIFTNILIQIYLSLFQKDFILKINSFLYLFCNQSTNNALENLQCMGGIKSFIDMYIQSKKKHRFSGKTYSVPNASHDLIPSTLNILIKTNSSQKKKEKTFHFSRLFPKKNRK